MSTAAAIPARHWTWIFAGTIATSLYLGLFMHRLTDDAFITLQIARTFATSGTWGMWAGVPSNTATSPLNVLILAGVIRVTGDPIIAAWLVGSLAYGVLLVALLAISRDAFQGRVSPGVAAYVAIVLNPLVVSTIGLETVPQFATLCVLVWCASRGWGWCAVIAGVVLTLWRPDGLLFAVATCVLVPSLWRPRYVLTYIALLVPWSATSWVMFGSAVPDTLFLKLSQKFAWSHSFATGPQDYFARLPWVTLTAVAFVPPALAWSKQAITATRSRALLLLLVLPLTQSAIYAAMAVPPFHWYYVPAVAALTVLGVFGLTIRPTRSRFIVGGMASVLAAVGVAASLRPWDEAPVSSNWATQAQYAEMGAWIKEHYPGRRIWIGGETGTLAYTCGCRVINEFADQGATNGIISDRFRDASLVIKFILTVNLAWRDMRPATKAEYLLDPSFEPGCASKDTIRQWHTGTRWNKRVTWCLTPADVPLQLPR